jgi:transglutaminase-like putative cysteine protease
VEGVTYRIHHNTVYHYSTPVRVCHNLVMLTPRSDHHCKLLSHKVQVRPASPTLRRREDYFGNTVYAFSIEESHRQLSVTSTARVRVTDRVTPAISPAWTQIRQEVATQEDLRWLEACRFGFNSPRIQSSSDFAAYASQSFTPGRGIIESAVDLSSRIHREFEYDKHATDVNTPTSQAFAQRSGVCQDFAHVQIACLRSLGLCARYVSGYLRTLPLPGQERLIGADQSHAWVSLYCGADIGWVDFDPTNDCVAGTNHIPIAWGRDYTDVTPMRGVFLGGGEHRMDVSVDVSPVEGI